MIEGNLLYRIVHKVCDPFPRTTFKILLSRDGGFTKRRMVVSYRRFGSKFWSHLQVSSSRRNFNTAKFKIVKLIHCHIYAVLTLLKLFTMKLCFFF